MLPLPLKGGHARVNGPLAPSWRLSVDATVTADLLEALEGEFAALLPALQRSRTGQVVAVTPVSAFRYVSLLPFHLHVRQPDALHWLPLTASIAVLPFAEGIDAAARPLYRLGEALAARSAARSARLVKQRDLGGDLRLADWEPAARERLPFRDAVFPPCAFVRIERVRGDGSTAHHARPGLGKHAQRDAPCPRVLVPGARELSDPAIKAFATADLVVVDLQRLRGQRALRNVRAVLRVRPSSCPTLIVAASPSDLLAAGLDDPPAVDRLVLVSSPSQLQSANVIAVGQDRLFADERFRSSLDGLVDYSAAARRLAALAENAWWAARSAIHADTGAQALRGFDRALEAVARDDAVTATLFTACHNLLKDASTDAKSRAERTRAAVHAVMQAGTSGAVLVLVRGWRDAAAVRAAIAADLDMSEDDLEPLDVWVRTVRSPPPRTAPGVAVLVGYAGMATIDAALASNAKTVRAVFDPVEARAAWYNARRMANYFDASGSPEGAAPLRRLCAGLEPYVTGFAEARELCLDHAFGDFGASGMELRKRPDPDEALVYLTDGSCLEVPLGARFEVLGQRGLGSRVRAVNDLRPSDQVVLLDEDAHALFSERRMAALDAGVLKEQCQKRAAWLAVVRAVALEKRLTPSAIARGMTARGERVTPAAVGRWLAENHQQATAPLGFEAFHTLADVLGVRLSQDEQRLYYRAIHEWRVLHRRAGREVAQAMRLAYTGRLGATSLARIERDWGVEVRALIDAAHVGVVDEVVLPESVVSEETNGAERSAER